MTWAAAGDQAPSEAIMANVVTIEGLRQALARLAEARDDSEAARRAAVLADVSWVPGVVRDAVDAYREAKAEQREAERLAMLTGHIPPVELDDDPLESGRGWS